MENGLTHFDKEGNAVMVDVSGKNVTYRTALATGYIAVGPEIMACVTEGNVKKGRCPWRGEGGWNHGREKNI